MKSTRSVGCNHFEEMYVIRNSFRYVINPKEDTPAVMPHTLRVITYAYRRLHQSPSDWIKIKHFRRSAFHKAGFTYHKKQICRGEQGVRVRSMNAPTLQKDRDFSSLSFFTLIASQGIVCYTFSVLSGGNEPPVCKGRWLA